MNMNKTVIGVIAGVIVLAGLFVVLASYNKSGMTNTANINHTDMPHTPNTSPAPQTSGDTTVKEGDMAIELKGFAFNPSTAKIKKGTKVTWTNHDDAHHDITPNSSSPHFVGSGKLLAMNDNYSFTFNTAGTYAYHCTPHPYMKATIEVVE